MSTMRCARTRSRWLAPLLILALLVPWPAEAVLTGKVAVTIDLKDVRTSDKETATSAILTAFGWDISNGTGADQANLCWQDTRSLTTGANEDLDLAGSLANLFGTAVFAQHKFIAIQAAAANTTVLTVTRPASNGVPFLVAAGDGFALGPGDFLILTRRASGGVTVTAGTGDLINVANASGATATFTVVVCGTS